MSFSNRDTALLEHISISLRMLALRREDSENNGLERDRLLRTYPRLLSDPEGTLEYAFRYHEAILNMRPSKAQVAAQLKNLKERVGLNRRFHLENALKVMSDPEDRITASWLYFGILVSEIERCPKSGYYFPDPNENYDATQPDMDYSESHRL